MATVNAEVRFAPQLTAWFAANPTKVLQDGEIVYCSDGANVGKYVIGDNSTALSGLTFYGGVSSSGLTIGTTTITSGTNTRILYNNAGVVGEYLVTGTGTTAVLSTSPTITNTITVTGSNAGALSSLFTNTNSGGYAYLGVVNDSNKSINLASFGSTTAIGTFYDADTAWVIANTTNTGIVNTHATGTIRLVVGGFGAVNERVRVGTATTHLLTNQVLINTTTAPGGSLSQVRIAKGTGLVDIGEWAAGRGGIWFNLATPTVSNFHVGANATGTDGYLNGSASSRLLVGGNIRLSVFDTRITFNPSAATGSNSNFEFTTPNNGSRTALTNVPNFTVLGGTNTWNPGAVPLQYFNWFTANTASTASASTFTLICNTYIDAPLTAGSATATNLAALGIGGHCFIANSVGVPSNNPTGGGLLYVEAGALKYRGSGGTVTTLGVA